MPAEHETLGDLVSVATYHNEFAAGVVCAKLEDAGIAAQSLASTGALIGAFGQSGWLPFTVWVRSADEARARAILETVRAEQGTVDWDAVDVGEPEAGDQIAQRIAVGTPARASRHTRMARAIGLFGASVAIGAVAMLFPLRSLAIPLWGLGFLCFICACGIAFGEMMRRKA